MTSYENLLKILKMNPAALQNFLRTSLVTQEITSGCGVPRHSSTAMGCNQKWHERPLHGPLNEFTRYTFLSPLTTSSPGSDNAFATVGTGLCWNTNLPSPFDMFTTRRRTVQAKHTWSTSYTNTSLSATEALIVPSWKSLFSFLKACDLFQPETCWLDPERLARLQVTPQDTKPDKRCI